VPVGAKAATGIALNHRCTPADDVRGGLVIVGTRASPTWIALLHGDDVVACEELADSTDEIVLTVPDSHLEHAFGMLALTVLSGPERARLRDVEVLLMPALAKRRSGRTDELGRARFERVPVGRFTVQIEIPGAMRVRRTFELAAGETLDLGEIVLSPPVRIEGVVVGAPGGTRVFARELPSIDLAVRESVEMRPPRGVTISADGRFAFENLRAAHYALTLTAHDVALAPAGGASAADPRVMVDATQGSATGVVLHWPDSSAESPSPVPPRGG
jgi:hypothetical protein